MGASEGMSTHLSTSPLCFMFFIPWGGGGGGGGGVVFSIKILKKYFQKNSTFKHACGFLYF